MNWGVCAHDVGPIIGVIIGMEVATAFFLEAGFVGIMLYGEDRAMATHAGICHFGVSAIGGQGSTINVSGMGSWRETMRSP